MSPETPGPDFQVGHTWYLWNGLVWQVYEIRALVDDDVVVWRTPRATVTGHDYTAVLRALLETYAARGQLLVEPPLRQSSTRLTHRPEERA